MTGLTVLLFLAIGVGQAQTSPDPALIRVYVHTAEGGHPDELAARRSSHKDLA